MIPRGRSRTDAVDAGYQAIATGNSYANTKYCMTAQSATASRRAEMKQAMNKAKTHEEACGVFGIDWTQAQNGVLAELLPNWVKRASASV